MVIKLLQFIACSLLFIAALELFARAEDSLRWGAPFTGHYHLEGLRTADARGTVRCAENARYKHFVLGEHGFRVTDHASEGDRRFVWLGSSEAFGLYETPGEDVANQLERFAVGQGQSLDVINASCFGLNLSRMTRLVEDPIVGLAPDFLALYPTPHFYLDTQVVAPDQPRTTPLPDPGFVSRALTKSRDVLKSFLPDALQDAVRRVQEQRAVVADDADWLWRELPVERLALFERHLRELVEKSVATGAEVALLTHANAFRGVARNDSILQAWRKFYPRASGDVLLQFDDAANDLVRRLAAEYDVQLIDVAEELAGDPELFADFSHFTDRGATRTAEALNAWVNSVRP